MTLVNNIYMFFELKEIKEKSINNYFLKKESAYNYYQMDTSQK